MLIAPAPCRSTVDLRDTRTAQRTRRGSRLSGRAMRSGANGDVELVEAPRIGDHFELGRRSYQMARGIT
jgi:hypothetical protein